MNKNKIIEKFGVKNANWKEPLNTCITTLKEQ